MKKYRESIETVIHIIVLYTLLIELTTVNENNYLRTDPRPNLYYLYHTDDGFKDLMRNIDSRVIQRTFVEKSY